MDHILCNQSLEGMIRILEHKSVLHCLSILQNIRNIINSLFDELGLVSRNEPTKGKNRPPVELQGDRVTCYSHLIDRYM